MSIIEITQMDIDAEIAKTSLVASCQSSNWDRWIPSIIVNRIRHDLDQVNTWYDSEYLVNHNVRYPDGRELGIIIQGDGLVMLSGKYPYSLIDKITEYRSRLRVVTCAEESGREVWRSSSKTSQRVPVGGLT